MVIRQGRRKRGCTLAEVREDAHRTWIFHFGYGAVPRFAAICRHGARSVTWPDVQRTVAEREDLNTLPDGIAAWMVQLTGGAMPAAVAKEAAVRIGRWLAVEGHGIARQRARNRSS